MAMASEFDLPRLAGDELLCKTDLSCLCRPRRMINEAMPRINPQILTWARESAGLSLEDARVRSG